MQLRDDLKRNQNVKKQQFNNFIVIRTAYTILLTKKQETFKQIKDFNNKKDCFKCKILHFYRKNNK